MIAAAPHDVNGCVLTESTTRGVFVNAVDDPANATAFAGSVFTRGPVTVALSTGSEAPALSRVLREALEQLIGHDVEHWRTLAATLRRERSETACRWWSDATLCSRRSLTCTSKRVNAIRMPHQRKATDPNTIWIWSGVGIPVKAVNARPPPLLASFSQSIRLNTSFKTPAAFVSNGPRSLFPQVAFTTSFPRMRTLAADLRILRRQ